MPRIAKTFIATFLCGLLVTACGGSADGGTGAATSAAATTFPLSTALVNLYATGFQKTISVSGTAQSTAGGTSSPFTASLSVTETPVYAGFTFENQAVRQKTSTNAGVFNINGIDNGFVEINQDFLSTNNLLLGTLTPVSYCVASSPGQYPGTITIGQAQAVATYQCYANSAKTSATGTDKLSFLVSPGNSPTTAIFSVIEVFVDTTGAQTQYTQKNYLIDTSGAISFLSLSFSGLLISNANGATNGIQVSFKSQ
ncbi:MAG: hypothetical protein P4L96_05235 [Rhodoferax sp.]|nr:hypothetical protein [Rhodoferax sp.]